MEKSSEYMFRAECFTDLFGFFKVLVVMHPGITIKSVSIQKKEDVPDVEVQMEVLGVDLEKIRSCMDRAHDGHVMAETLDYAERYTGRRLERPKLYR